jgi:hypothetical protein
VPSYRRNHTRRPTDSSTGGAPAQVARVVHSSRKGKKVVAGYFDPAVSKQLRQLELEHDTTVQALLAEALDLLFVERSKMPIAGSNRD